MYSKDGSSISIRKALGLSSALAALTAASILALPDANLRKPQIQFFTKANSKPIEVKVPNVFWWANADFTTNKGLNRDSSQVANIDESVKSIDIISDKEISKILTAQPELLIRKTYEASKRTMLKVAQHKLRPTYKKDRVVISRAHSEPQIKVIAVNVINEDIKIRNIHTLLRNQFLAAVRGEIESKTTTSTFLAKSPEVIKKQIIEDSISITSAAPVIAEVEEIGPSLNEAELNTPKLSIQMDTQLPSRSKLIAKKENKLTKDINERKNSETVIEEDIVSLNLKSDEYSEYSGPPRSTGPPDRVEVDKTKSNQVSNEAQPPAGLSHFYTPSVKYEVNTQFGPSADLKTEYSAVSVAMSASSSHSNNQQTTANVPSKPIKKDVTPLTNTPKCKVSYESLYAHSAFDPNIEIATIKREVSSYGSDSRMDCGSGAWVLYGAQDYWSTIAPMTKELTMSGIPLISKNNALILGQLLDGKSITKESAGIVFGKVPKNWKVELSHHQKSPIYIGYNREPLDAYDTGRDRYFAFVNVAPGTKILYLVEEYTKKTVPVVIPVVEGIASYLPLTVPSLKSLEIVMYNAYTSKPVIGAELEVEKQLKTKSVTNDLGKAIVQNLLYVEDIEYFINVKTVENVYLSYSFLPEESKKTIYAVEKPQISKWVYQLGGKLSAQAGYVLASTKKTVAKAYKDSQERVFAKVKTVHLNTNLVPETYLLNSRDELLVNTPLDKPARFVGVQMPEGVNRVEIEDKAQKIWWKKFVFTSPGVVSVLSD